MKGLDKITPIRLAEVLTQKGVVESNAVADALYAQDKLKESFADVLVSGGHITEWDLAKLVVEHFQLPFIMASGYDVTAEARDAVPKEILFSNLLVPLDVFDDVVTVVMPILTPYDVLRSLQKEHKLEVFPYVGLTSENKAVLATLFPDFKDWFAGRQVELDKKRKQRAQRKGPDSWMSLFDSADAAVRDALK